MDHVTLVVDDMPAAIAFFGALGMELVGEASVEGPWVDRLCGMEDVQADIAMMRSPESGGQIELTKYRNPELVSPDPAIPPPNTLGLRQIMFLVDNLEQTLSDLRSHGAELMGEIVHYENLYKLCYLRGPASSIIALSEQMP
jgi:catechol 2,3-dioxygenase-like lactoylglutathione lyase family enzyme